MMLTNYLPILLFLLIAIAFAGGTILLSSVIVPRRSNRVKNSAYECGVDPVGDTAVDWARRAVEMAPAKTWVWP